ncbi:MAG: single-stranded DNA-binding protein [Verrucomicrobia bacterium]|nr:single-stranded DNA-binding protein [Verrucomicrobiota bacterium]
MANLNKVMLIGNLTKDPEVRFTPSGKAVGDLRMAVNRRFKTADGETKDETCYVSVVVWGNTAQNCQQYLRKGSSLFVEGRLQYEEWEKEGQKFNRMRVVAEYVQFVGGRGGDGGEGGGGRGAKREEPSQAEAPAAAGEPPPSDAKDADDLPF